MLARTVLIGLLALWVGCSKPSSSAPATPGAGSPGASADETQITAALGELTQAVRRYAAEQRRVPKTLEELVAGGYLSRVPEPPAGKKFTISQKLEVQLTER